MAGLKVTTAKPGKIKGVVYNTGMQGSTYNPQPAASGTVVQNTGRVQGHRATPAPAAPSSVQQAATAAQVAAAAEAQRRAVEAELARQKEARRQQVQGEVNVKVAAQKQQLQLKVTTAKPAKISGVGYAKSGKITMPKLSAVEQARVDAYWKAYNSYLAKRQGDAKGVGKVWDKLTFGQDRRDVAARKFAEGELEKLNKRGVEDFRKAINRFQSEQAKRRQGIEASKFKTKAEYDKAVADYGTWETTELTRLQQSMASLEGANSALGKAAKAPLTSLAGKIAGGFSKVTQGEGAIGKVWQYTLGQGDKNVPSIVTAPSRVINFFGNLNTGDRNIYKTGGATVKRAPGIASAWQQTQNQRNFNIRPWVDKPFDFKAAEKKFGAEARKQADFWKRQGKIKDPELADYDSQLRRLWHGDNLEHRWYNSILETAADPLFGVSKVSKSSKLSELLSTATKSTRAGRFITSSAEKLAATKPMRWLTKEAKSPQQALRDAVDAARAGTADVQKRLLPRIAQINDELASAGKRLDVSVFDDFAGLSDYEASALQRMVGGKFSGTDRLRLIGRGSKAQRAKLEAIAAKWDDFVEQMGVADEIARTRFGKGKKFYAPRIDFTGGHNLENYNFRAAKKKGSFKSPFGYHYQKADELRTNAIHRYFKSNLDDAHAATQTAARAGRRAERTRLLKEYDDTVEPLRAEVQRLDRKTRTPLGRARGLVDRFGPTALWKKSVLKYRPAWYVNNFLYNTQAAALSGGGRALVEQARLLRPRNFRAALKEVPDEIKTNLANETGKGRLARFGSSVENLSRVAAFRALKKKGLSDEAALKRVNMYLLDYSTKNWERPLKAVVPFWSWQKGLTKAAARLPLDRPAAAIGYNRLDQYQQKQYNDDFDKIVPKLKEAGYSDADIQKIRAENAKYFKGRIKVGGRYFTTPFNAFSEKGLSNFGVNPWMSALGEVALSRDSFGRQLKGDESTFFSRFAAKVPQAQLAREGRAKFDITTGRRKPTKEWIGAAGSEGYGLTKQGQGYDPSKPNYMSSLNKGRKFTEDLAAFFGVPRSMPFDTTTLLRRKTMQKLKESYFAVDWDSLPFDQAEAKRNELFKRFGVTRDQFYKGELSKYDDDNTKRIKGLKEDAYEKTRKLFEEYGRQPQGTRNVWATNKLKELVDSGYFAKNPFLKSFDWTNPDTIQRARLKMAYDKAEASGNWDEFNRLYGDRRKSSPFQYAGKFFKSADSLKRFKDGEFWRRYIAADPVARRRLLRENPQYAKREVKSEADVAEADFWYKYARATPAARRQLIADNPQYNKRANWTDEMWDEWRAKNRTEERSRARTFGSVAENERRAKIIAQAEAALFAARPKRTRKVKFVL